MANLDDLPGDILYDIHLRSLSEHLPYVNHYLHAVLARPTVNRAARWLIHKYHRPRSPIRSFLGKALECGVCDLQVVLEVERIWETEMSPSPAMHDQRHTEHTPRHHAHDSKRTRPLISEPLTCPLLPKRLFRHRRPISETLAAPISPLLQHLFNVYSPSPNSHRGYPLCRAVMYSDIPLIEYLLIKGANPAEKDYLAVQIAFSKKDMRIIRLLIDGPSNLDTDTDGQLRGTGAAGSTLCGGGNAPTGSKRKRVAQDAPDVRPESSRNKRQRYTDYTPPSRQKSTRLLLTQPLVDSVVSRGSPEMIQYIIQERGYMPSLKAIVKLK